MIVKNFINGQITTGTEPIDPISGVSRGLYINSVLSGSSSSDTLVGLDINPSYSGTAGNYFGLRVSGDTIFATSGGTQVFRTTSNGNVIVGESDNTGYKLDVGGVIRSNTHYINTDSGIIGSFSSAGGDFITLSGLNANSQVNISVGDYGSYPKIAQISMGAQSSHWQGYISFWTRNPTFAERMRLTYSGNLLIGTTTDAGYKLDVNGGTRIKGDGATSGTTGFTVVNSSNEVALQVLNNKWIGMQVLSPLAPLHVYYPGTSPNTKTIAIFDGYQSPAQPTIQIQVGTVSSGLGAYFGYDTAIVNSVRLGGFLKTVNATIRALTWNDQSNVGIGGNSTTNNCVTIYPKNFGSASSFNQTGAMLRIESGTLTVIPSGLPPQISMVGLGTQIVSTNVLSRDYENASNLFIDGPPVAGQNTTFINRWSIYVNSGSTYFGGKVMVGLTGDTGFQFTSSGSTLLRGSGTTSASYALATQNSSGGTTMVVNDAGNMLIGTTTDAGYKLDVNGNTSIRGSLSITDTVGTLRTAISGYDNNEIAFRGTRWASSSVGEVYFANGQFQLSGGDRIISGNQDITISNVNGNVPNSYITLKGEGPNNAYTGLTKNIVNVTISNTVPSGSSAFTFNVLNISPSLNYSGVGGVSTVRGIYYNPTITSLAGNHISIQTTVGNALLGTTSGNVILGMTSDFGQRLQVSGTSLFMGVIPFSANNQTIAMVDIQPNFNRASYTGTTAIALRVSGNTQIIGSGSTGTTLSLFSVDGASGRLFDVTDDFTNSLFSVNTSSGVPVIEAFANNSIVMGTYGSNTLVVSGTSVGIGKTSPSYKLDVNGDINVSERLLIESYSSATTQNTSVISASTTNSNLALVPNGTGAIVVSVPDATSIGGNSRGNYAVDLQKNRLLSTNVASGNYSSIVGGYNNAAIGEYSISVGKDSNSYLYGQQSFSSGYFVSVGDAQHSTVFLRGVGTGGTAFSFYLTLDGTSSGNYLTPSGDNRTWGVKVLYTATCIQPGVGNNYVKGDSSMGEYLVLLRKSGGTTSIIDTSSSIKVSSSLFINDRLTFDIGSNQDLRLLYTAPSASVNGNVIRTVAKLTLIEIGY